LVLSLYRASGSKSAKFRIRNFARNAELHKIPNRRRNDPWEPHGPFLPRDGDSEFYRSPLAREATMTSAHSITGSPFRAGLNEVTRSNADRQRRDSAGENSECKLTDSAACKGSAQIGGIFRNSAFSAKFRIRNFADSLPLPRYFMLSLNIREFALMGF
jgi:hypothetical protein